MAYSKQEGPALIIPPYNQVGPPSYTREVTVPDSTKRKKPVDLFAASTPRTVIESISHRSLYHAFTSGNKHFFGVLQVGREKSFDFSSVNNECRLKLANKIKGQNINLAQAMIEFRQSADLFLSLSQELYMGYKSLKYGHFRGSFRSLNKSKELSKKWIEYQFGLAPLVSDLTGLADSLALGLRDGLELQASQTISGRYQTYSRTFPDGYGNMIEHFERENFTVRMKARYKIQHTSVHNIARFGFFNMPALGWELVPFSFVVDWAIPVGSWLESLDALHGISEIIYVQGTRNEWAGQRSMKSATANARTVHKTRTQSISGLPISFPVYKPSQSLVKIVTGLALLRLIQKG